MLIRGSGLINTASGAIGGVVFTQAKSGLVVGRRPQHRASAPPMLPDYLVNPQARMQYLINAWAALTSAERLEWAQFALQYPLTNRVGLQRPITGYQWFLRHNLDFYGLTQTHVTNPPRLGITFPVLTLTAAFTAGGAYTASWTAPTYSGTPAFQFYGVPLYRPTFPKTPVPMRRLDGFPPGSGSANIATSWARFLPVLVSGQKFQIGVRVIESDHIVSPMRTVTGTAA